MSECLFEFVLSDDSVFGFLRGVEDGMLLIEVPEDVFGAGLLTVPLGSLVAARMHLPDTVPF